MVDTFLTYTNIKSPILKYIGGGLDGWLISATLLLFLLQESSEDVSGGLPFLVDLALGLSVLACSMLRILYNGPEITKDEETCQELLRSKLLQR